MITDFKRLDCDKTRFTTEKDAVFYIEKLKKTSIRDKRPKSAYLCPHCLSWHLTSQDQKYDNRIAKYTAEIKRLGFIIKSLNEKIESQKKQIKELIKKNVR